MANTELLSPAQLGPWSQPSQPFFQWPRAEASGREPIIPKTKSLWIIGKTAFDYRAKLWGISATLGRGDLVAHGTVA